MVSRDCEATMSRPCGRLCVRRLLMRIISMYIFQNSFLLRSTIACGSTLPSVQVRRGRLARLIALTVAFLCILCSSPSHTDRTPCACHEQYARTEPCRPIRSSNKALCSWRESRTPSTGPLAGRRAAAVHPPAPVFWVAARRREARVAPRTTRV